MHKNLKKFLYTYESTTMNFYYHRRIGLYFTYFLLDLNLSIKFTIKKLILSPTHQ